MNNMIFRKINKTLFLLLVAAGIAGCVREEGSEYGTPAAANPDAVTITVNVPGQQIPTTRAMADGAGEAAIGNIDVLVFKADGTLTEHKAGVIVSQSAVKAEKYKVKFQAALSTDADASTVAIIANVADIESLIDGLTAKEDILTALTAALSGAWGANSTNVAEPEAGTDYMPIPMYGEAEVASGVTAGMKIDDVPLTRMLARIDVVLADEVDNFAITEVYLVNYNTAGYVAPAWGADGVLETALPASPMIPSSNVAKTGEANKLTYSGTELVGGIYTFEALKNSGTEGSTAHNEAICLIVKGLKDGDTTDTYYRIDFTDSKDAAGKTSAETGFNPATVGYMPLYRNHLYRFEIGAVDGSGHGSFADALKSSGVLNNLRTTLHVIDQSGIKDMVFNGQHFLGLGDSAVFDPQSGIEMVVPCITNYSDGWEIVEIEWLSGGEDWLKADKGTDEIELETLTENIDDSSLPDVRKAYVHLVAGKITHKLLVMQEGLYPVFIVTPTSGTVAYTGGSQTISVTSYALTSKADGTTSTSAVKWISEFSDDDGATWTTDPVEGVSFPAGGVGGDEAEYTATLAITTPTVLSVNDEDLTIQAADLVGSAASPYDLSMRLGSQNTANCYVINAAGFYKLPLVYGNAIKDGFDNPSAYLQSGTMSTFFLTTFARHDDKAISGPYIWDQSPAVSPSSAKVIWMDAPGLIVNVELDADKKYLVFETAPQESIKQGNAVVAVCDDGGTVLWSWHIWIAAPSIFNADTPQTVATVNATSVTYNFMEYNLGWTTGSPLIYDLRTVKFRITQTDINNPAAEKEVTITQAAGSTPTTGGHSLHWQWGRKDPFPSTNGTGNTIKTIWRGESDGTRLFANVTLGTSIQYPQEFVIQTAVPSTWAQTAQPIAGNALGQFYNLWNATNTVGTANDNPIIKTVYDPSPIGFTMPAPNAWTGAGSTASYPAAGYIYMSGGATNIGKSSYYWSAGPSDGVRGRYLGSATLLNVGVTGYGYAVRCTAE